MTPVHLMTSGRSVIVYMTLLIAGAFAHDAHAGEYAKSFSVTNRASVHVDSNDGSVRVTTGEANQVEFRVEYSGYEPDKTLHIEAHSQGDEVYLSAKVTNSWSFTLGNVRRLRIEVRMPKNGDLNVDTGDGSISVEGLSGTTDLHSGDGRLTAAAVKGVMHLRTGDGAIEGSDLDGSCDAISGDGHIRLAGRFDVLQAKSGDGRIEVNAAQGSKLDSTWNIATGDGGIDVALPGDLHAAIDATSGDGHISSDIPISVEGVIGKSRLRGKMNGGGPTLSIHSGDGSIHLRSIPAASS